MSEKWANFTGVWASKEPAILKCNSCKYLEKDNSNYPCKCHFKDGFASEHAAASRYYVDNERGSPMKPSPDCKYFEAGTYDSSSSEEQESSNSGKGALGGLGKLAGGVATGNVNAVFGGAGALVGAGAKALFVGSPKSKAQRAADEARAAAQRAADEAKEAAEIAAANEVKKQGLIDVNAIIFVDPSLESKLEQFAHIAKVNKTSLFSKDTFVMKRAKFAIRKAAQKKIAFGISIMRNNGDIENAKLLLKKLRKI